MNESMIVTPRYADVLLIIQYDLYIGMIEEICKRREVLNREI